MSSADRRDSARSFYFRIKRYDRIMRSGSSLAGGLTIYANEEQLALVSMDGIREYVKYIEYKNIRAVLIQRHSLVLKTLLILLVTVGVLALIFLAGDGFTPAFAGWLFPVAFVSGALMLSLRNCTVRIVTDVYDHHLSQVQRYRQARRLLDAMITRMEPYLEPSAEPGVEEPGAAPPVPDAELAEGEKEIL